MLIRTLLSLALSVLYLSGGDEAENPKTFQKPFVEYVEGWPVEWNQEFKKKYNKNLFSDSKKALANHLQRITYILDPERVKQLRNLFIRVDIDHKLGNMQYHPSRGWLLSNRHDPSMEKRVHMSAAFYFGLKLGSEKVKVGKCI